MCAVRYNKETRDQCSSSLSLLAEKGNVEGVNQLYDFLSKKELKAMPLTEPLVQVHLVRYVQFKFKVFEKRAFKYYITFDKCNQILFSKHFLITFLKE